MLVTGIDIGVDAFNNLDAKRRGAFNGGALGFREAPNIIHKRIIGEISRSSSCWSGYSVLFHGERTLDCGRVVRARGSRFSL